MGKGRAQERVRCNVVALHRIALSVKVLHWRLLPSIWIAVGTVGVCCALAHAPATPKVLNRALAACGLKFQFRVRGRGTSSEDKKKGGEGKKKSASKPWDDAIGWHRTRVVFEDETYVRSWSRGCLWLWLLLWWCVCVGGGVSVCVRVG